jgi:hypothetical protein
VAQQVLSAVGQRLTGGEVSRPKALAASLVAGIAATVLTYKWLRSSAD